MTRQEATWRLFAKPWSRFTAVCFGQSILIQLRFPIAPTATQLPCFRLVEILTFLSVRAHHGGLFLVSPTFLSVPVTSWGTIAALSVLGHATAHED
jgi:hypothetical protein